MLRRDEVTSKVNVLDIVAGEPAFILLAQCVTRPDGKQRTITQKVRVLDKIVLSRLFAEVINGSDIEATIVTEWSKDGYTTYLSDFRALVLPSEEGIFVQTAAAKAS